MRSCADALLAVLVSLLASGQPSSCMGLDPLPIAGDEVIPEVELTTRLNPNAVLAPHLERDKIGHIKHPDLITAADDQRFYEESGIAALREEARRKAAELKKEIPRRVWGSSGNQERFHRFFEEHPGANDIPRKLRKKIPLTEHEQELYGLHHELIDEFYDRLARVVDAVKAKGIRPDQPDNFWPGDPKPER